MKNVHAFLKHFLFLHQTHIKTTSNPQDPTFFVAYCGFKMEIQWFYSEQFISIASSCACKRSLFRNKFLNFNNLGN
jgi:hypothetical protein